jgi:hypothetical protein
MLLGPGSLLRTGNGELTQRLVNTYIEHDLADKPQTECRGACSSATTIHIGKEDHGSDPHLGARASTDSCTKIPRSRTRDR